MPTPTTTITAVSTTERGSRLPRLPWPSRAVDRAPKAPKPKAPPPRETDLYDVLGVRSDASNRAIQVAYRRRAAALSDTRATHRAELKALNAAYEVLGHEARRAEYDRLRLLSNGQPAEPHEPLRPKRYPRFHHPHPVSGNYGAGYGELAGVVLVVGLALVAGVYFLGRVAVDLSPVTTVARTLGIATSDQRVPLETTPAAAPAIAGVPIVAATATAPAGATPTPSIPVADQFKGSTASVSDPRPRRGSTENVIVKLVRNGKPASGVDVWAESQYRTVLERTPQAGGVTSNADGVATIVLSVGDATPGFEVKVNVRAQVDGQDLSWPTSFTPQ